MNRNVIEILIGFLVIAIAVGFLIYTYKVADVKKLGSCYEVKAKFDQVEGVIVGSDAMISGIKVGTVTGLTLYPQTYSAIMIIGIGDNVKLPVDSSARIVSSGLLGGKYVDLQPGADDQMLKNDDTIQYTQSSINLESLLGKFIFSASGSSNKTPANTSSSDNENKAPASAPTPAN